MKTVRFAYLNSKKKVTSDDFHKPEESLREIDQNQCFSNIDF